MSLAEPRTRTEPVASRARAHLRARDWARSRRSTRLALQAFVLVIGVTLLAAGAAMLVLPGPGWAAIILGLVVLASEFEWAERRLGPLRHLAARATARVRRTRAPERAAFEPGRLGRWGCPLARRAPSPREREQAPVPLGSVARAPGRT